MKELIEKIKELQDVLNHSHCCQVVCSQIIGMIENQESKPFNPLELGFEMSLSFIKLPNKSYSKNTEKGCFEINHFNNGLFKVTGIQQLIKIPNHRQGVELLRNLGIIDAD